MTITLELPPEVEARLVSEAARRGVTVIAYAAELVSRPNELPTTGLELVAYWQDAGLLGGRRDVKDSAKQARSLRRQSNRRK